MKIFFEYLKKPFSTRGNVVFTVFLVAAGYFLITEHTAHILGAAPYLLLLVCIGMHLFMHGGHGHNHDHSTQQARNSKEGQKP